MKKKSTQNPTPIGIDQMLKTVKKVLISGIGGGGDVVTALHVRWTLEKIAPHTEWVHGGVTGSDVTHFEAIEQIDENSAWITEKSKSAPPHRLIEAVIARRIKEKIFVLSCYHGVGNMVKSLNAFIKSEKIEMVIYIDGGTDSLAFLGCSAGSIVEDTMGLAALGLGEYDMQLKHRVAGVSVIGVELPLHEISLQLLKISQAGGYVGGTFFPIERISDYAEIISEVLQYYPTATALAPLLVTKTSFDTHLYPYRPIINGFQLATFLFDASIAATVGNDFTSLIFKEPSRQSAKQAIRRAMTELNPESKD